MVPLLLFSPPSPSTFPSVPYLFPFKKKKKASHRSQQSMWHQIEAGPSSSPPASRLNKASTIGNRIQGACSYLGLVLLPPPGSQQKTKPHNCHPDTEGLVQSHADTQLSMKSLWAHTNTGLPSLCFYQSCSFLLFFFSDHLENVSI